MDAGILVRIQSSGKFTFFRETFFDTHLRISLNLLKTRARERAFLETCLRTRQLFVVDNTNVLAAGRAVYIAAAKAAGFHVRCYFFDAELKDALRRNKLRSGRAVIPMAGVIATPKRLQRPSITEGFDELNVVIAASKTSSSSLPEVIAS